PVRRLAGAPAVVLDCTSLAVGRRCVRCPLGRPELLHGSGDRCHCCQYTVCNFWPKIAHHEPHSQQPAEHCQAPAPAAPLCIGTVVCVVLGVIIVPLACEPVLPTPA